MVTSCVKVAKVWRLPLFSSRYILIYGNGNAFEDAIGGAFCALSFLQYKKLKIPTYESCILHWVITTQVKQP